MVQVVKETHSKQYIVEYTIVLNIVMNLVICGLDMDVRVLKTFM